MDLLLARLSGEFSIDQTIRVAILVTARVIPLALITPWIVLRAKPNPILITVSGILAALLTPFALRTTAPLPTVNLELSLLIIREILVGTVFAIASALPFYALEWSGRLTDTLRDPSFREFTSISGPSTQTPLRTLYVMTGMVLFFSIGGHRLAIKALADTFIVLPIGSVNIPATIRTVSWDSVRLVETALTLSIVLAAPIAAMIALSEFVLGLVGRSLPNLSLYFIAAVPLRALVALVGVLFSISLIVDMLPQIFRESIEAASAIIRQFAR